MTREEIIRIARGAGLLRMTPIPDDSEFVAELERFAALVISHHVKETRVKPTASQLEIFQQLAYQHGGIGDLCGTEFEFANLVAAHEREACAKMFDGEVWAYDYREIAAAIRARGEKS